MPGKTGWPDFHLATAYLSGNWDKDNPKYRLSFILACGSEILTARNRKYEADLKQCLIALYLDGGKPDFSCAYSWKLPIKSKVTEKDIRKRSTSHGGGFDVGGTAGAKLSLTSGFFSRLKFRLSRGAESLRTVDQSVTFEQFVSLISHQGDHWAVGDDHRGDPRIEGRWLRGRYFGGWLSGRYFYFGGWLRGRYFDEDPIKPLCTVDLLKGHAKAKVMVIVWARPDQIKIYELDANGQVKREARRGNRSKALEVLWNKARIRMILVSKRKRTDLPKGLPPFDAGLPSEAYPLALDALTVQQA